MVVGGIFYLYGMTTPESHFAPNSNYLGAVVSLITRWPLNLNDLLSLFLMSLALRLLFFCKQLAGIFLSLSLFLARVEYLQQ